MFLRSINEYIIYGRGEIQMKTLQFFVPFVMGAILSVTIMRSPPSSPLFQKKHGFGTATNTHTFSNVSTHAVRSYWNAQPCNSRWRFPNVAFGTREHWELVTERKYTVESHIPDFANFSAWRGKRVLEVGGGMCTTAISFALSGAQLTVIDLSEKSMQLCRQRFEVYGVRADIRVGDAQRLLEWMPEAAGAFDLVWSFGVIHHMPRPEQAIQNVIRALKPGGTLKIMMYSKISMKLFWIMHNTGVWAFSHMDQLVAHYSEAVEGSPVTYTYTVDELQTLLHPLHTVNIFKSHIFKYDVSAYKKGILLVDAAFQNVSDTRFNQLEQELGWHLCATAVKLSTVVA